MRIFAYRFYAQIRKFLSNPVPTVACHNGLMRLARFAAASPHLNIYKEAMVRAILGGILAAIGALAIIVHGMIWFAASSMSKTIPDDASVVGSLLSPDSKYKAVIFNQNGGGGFAPYCFDFVSVIPESIADRDAWGEEFLVFAASCGSLTFAKWGDDIKWKSANELQITFDPTVGARGISQLRLKGDAAHGKVSISFTLKN